MDADGHNPRQVFHDSGSDMSGDWSPDGTLIVLTSTRTTGNLQLYTISIDGQNLKRLTNNTLEDEYARFSSDGKSILFGRRDNACGDVYAIDLDGRNQRRITDNGCASSPAMP